MRRKMTVAACVAALGFAGLGAGSAPAADADAAAKKWGPKRCETTLKRSLVAADNGRNAKSKKLMRKYKRHGCRRFEG